MTLTIMTATLGTKVAAVYTIVTAIFSFVIGFSLEKLEFEKAVKNVIMTGFQEQTAQKFNLQSALKDTVALIRTVLPYVVIVAEIGSIIHGAVPISFITTYFGGDQWW